VNLERVFADRGTRPYAIHKVVLGHKFIGRTDQDLNDLERSRADWHRDAARQQLSPSEMDLPLTRLIDQVLTLCRHSSGLDSGSFRFAETLTPKAGFGNLAWE
jgi:hypothetical protein